MGVVEFLFALFKAVAALPTLVGYVEQFASSISIWYIERNAETRAKELLDAAALAARAKTQPERLAALDAWRKALSAPRIES